MKIYILADMEGGSGIDRLEQAEKDGGAPYRRGCELMLADVNAAVDGALAGGATEVVVRDAHSAGNNIRPEDVDPRAVFEKPAVGGRLMPSLDESFAGVVLLGHHAMAGTLNAFLDHTMNARSWFECRINDQPVGEIGIEAAWAGHYNVPVIAVTGDAATAAEARETLGDVETAVVKTATRRNTCEVLPLDDARALIRETVRRAVAAVKENPSRFKPFRPALPATIQLTLCRSDMAEYFLDRNPEVERLDARTIRRTMPSLLDVHKW